MSTAKANPVLNVFSAVALLLEALYFLISRSSYSWPMQEFEQNHLWLGLLIFLVPGALAAISFLRPQSILGKIAAGAICFLVGLIGIFALFAASNLH